MVNRTNSYFDSIDVENLFQSWHSDIRKFTSNLNQECVLEIIKRTEIETFSSSKYREILNFTNTRECKQILSRVLREKDTNNFLTILKERDLIHPRDIERGYSIEQILELVKTDTYHPILFLHLDKKYYIIDGRTRFYCCIFLNIPAKVRTLYDYEIANKCKINKKN